MWEYLVQLLHYLPAGIGYTTLIGIALAVLARFIPNEKLQNYGYKFGVVVSAAGTLKLGKAWEKVEDFCINSVGQLLQGFKNGLQADDAGDPQIPSSNDGKPDVRI
jgi:hypothetical protein